MRQAMTVGTSSRTRIAGIAVTGLVALAVALGASLAGPAAATGGSGGFPWRGLPLCDAPASASLRVATTVLPRALEFSARAPGSTALGLVVDSFAPDGESITRFGPLVLPDETYTGKLRDLGRRPGTWIVSAAARMLVDDRQCRVGVVVRVERTGRGVVTRVSHCAAGAKGSSRVLRCKLRTS